jgi:hypothetical protein
MSLEGIDNAADHAVRETSSNVNTLDSLFSQPSNDVVENNDAPDESNVPGIEPEQEIESHVDEEVKAQEDAVQEAINKLKIKANGQEHEFELSPDNAELIEALEYGVAGKKNFSKANKLVSDAKKRISELESKYANYEDVSSKAKTIDEITSLVEKGYADEAVKALLGERYDDFKRNEIISTIDYENASPSERAEMDRDRAEREKSRIQEKTQQEIQALKQQLEEQSEAVETDRWQGLGENLLAKYSMTNYTDDPVRAEKLNNKIWDMVWNDMAKVDTAQWTPRKLEQTFRENTSLFRGNLKKMADDRVAKVIEAKKEEATEQAQMVARRNYEGNDSSKNSFVKEIGKSTSALDRLKMLSNLR